jgi:uncharacterized membrane protein
MTDDNSKTAPETVPDDMGGDGLSNVELPEAIKSKLRDTTATVQRGPGTSLQRLLAVLPTGTHSVRNTVQDALARRPAWTRLRNVPLPQIPPELRDGMVERGRRAGLQIGSAIDTVVKLGAQARAGREQLKALPAPSLVTLDPDIRTIAVQRAVKQPAIFGASHILTAVLAGGIIHIATTFAITALGGGSAYRQLRPVLPANQVVVLPAPVAGAQILPFLAPDMMYAVCRFDLGGGSVVLNAVLPEVGWSLALYTRQGDNFYAAPGNKQRPVKVAILLQPTTDRLVNLHPGTPRTDAETNEVTSPDSEGLMVVRAPLKGIAFEPGALAELKKASCKLSQK